MTESGDRLMQAQQAERERQKKAKAMKRCPICGVLPDRGHARYCVHRRHEGGQGEKGKKRKGKECS